MEQQHHIPPRGHFPGAHKPARSQGGHGTSCAVRNARARSLKGFQPRCPPPAQRPPSARHGAAPAGVTGPSPHGATRTKRPRSAAAPPSTTTKGTDGLKSPVRTRGRNATSGGSAGTARHGRGSRAAPGPTRSSARPAAIHRPAPLTRRPRSAEAERSARPREKL